MRFYLDLRSWIALPMYFVNSGRPLTGVPQLLEQPLGACGSAIKVSVLRPMPVPPESAATREPSGTAGGGFLPLAVPLAAAALFLKLR